MLKLLLDEHISPKVAQGLHRRNPRIVVHCMSEWEEGEFLGRDDAACLSEAAKQSLTLVTYDRRTIPLLLKIWAEEGQNLGGVIFIDNKTIPPAEIGPLVRAVADLFEETEEWDWQNRVCFLQRT